MQDFVDDLLTGASTLEKAQQLQHDLIQMLKSGGFNLRKWSRNTTHLIEQLPSEMRHQSVYHLQQDEPNKSLGVLWQPRDDICYFQVKTYKQITPTKRHILSEIIYDPLGWMTHITIKANLLIQELWKKQMRWDQVVDYPTAEEWSRFQRELHGIEEIKIPR